MRKRILLLVIGIPLALVLVVLLTSMFEKRIKIEFVVEQAEPAPEAEDTVQL